jgi:hypothetical protein
LYPERYERYVKHYAEEEVFKALLDATKKIGLKPTQEMLLGHPLPPQFKTYLD